MVRVYDHATDNVIINKLAAPLQTDETLMEITLTIPRIWKLKFN